MIKVTYDQLTDQEFVQALHALGEAPNLPTKISYDISKITGPLKKKLGRLQKEFQPIMDAHAEKDANGKMIFNKEAQGYKVRDDMQESLKAAREEFGARTFELDRPKLTYKELGNVQLSPNALTALEPLLQLLDEPHLSVVS